MEEEQESLSLAKQKTRKRPVKTEFHFPIYPLSIALEVAGKVEEQGAGSLSEASLAMALGASAKSSGFRLRILTAKQFGLMAKQGENLMTTPLAKSIFKPVSSTEKSAALAQAFNNIRLFKAVSDRYQGSPLPSGEALRNILEREFKVTHERVSSAESMLLNSAKSAGVLQESQGKVYLVRKHTGDGAVGTPAYGAGGGSQPPTPPVEGVGPVTATWNVSIDTKDLAGMDAEAIKATMDGLERLAKIVALRERETEEGFEEEKKERD